MSNPAPRPSGRPPLAVISLGLGAVAIPTLFCFGLGLPMGLAAVVTGVVSLLRGRGGGDAGRAAAGIALGLVALVGGAILVLRPDT